MFWPFRRSQGWRKVTGKEGFVVDMPAQPVRKQHTVEKTAGQTFLNIYSAVVGPLTCHLTVHAGPAVEAQTDAALLNGWKSEFLASMASAGIEMQPVSESPWPGGLDLFYQRPGGTVVMHVRLIRDMANLFVLNAIGPPELVNQDGTRFLNSFTITGV